MNFSEKPVRTNAPIMDNLSDKREKQTISSANFIYWGENKTPKVG